MHVLVRSHINLKNWVKVFLCLATLTSRKGEVWILFLIHLIDLFLPSTYLVPKRYYRTFRKYIVASTLFDGWWHVFFLTSVYELHSGLLKKLIDLDVINHWLNLCSVRVLGSLTVFIHFFKTQIENYNDYN